VFYRNNAFIGVGCNSERGFRMIFSAHQPDIFPWVGLFLKMDRSDYFDFAVYDDYVKDRFMSRVKIGYPHQLTWMNVPVFKKSNTCINQITLKSSWKDSLNNQILRQYKKFPFFNQRKHIVERVLDGNYLNLSDLGMASIKVIYEHLSPDSTIITNTLGYSLKQGYGGIGVVELIKRYEKYYEVDLSYLSGEGGREYMDLNQFKNNNIDVVWHKVNTQYKCSILTPMFLEEDFFNILKDVK
jgi:hypothetical protein